MRVSRAPGSRALRRRSGQMRPKKAQAALDGRGSKGRLFPPGSGAPMNGAAKKTRALGSQPDAAAAAPRP
jgi:hypothetical protein